MSDARSRAQAVGWIAAAAVAVAAVAGAKPALRWLDIHVAAEAGKDALGRWTSDEDWSAVPPLPTGLDYRWLGASGRRPLVAHALGEASLPGQNTLAALRRALAGGLRVLEVDLWLDDEGRLRCHHGPAPPPRWRPGDCEFSSVLQEAVAAGAWVVPDLKTDFDTTADALLAQLRSDEQARHVVLQLYRPMDVQRFSGWAQRRPLAGPIVTSYLARRSLGHVARHAARAGVKALTVPLYRRAALSEVPAGLQVLVHPVHDCPDLRAAPAGDGLYLRTDLLPLIDGGCPP